jgi:hypothetical protein
MANPPEKINRFKPSQPSIPGVPERPPEEEKKEEPKPQEVKGPIVKPVWQSPRGMAGAGIGAFILLAGVALAWEVMKPAPTPAPVVIATPEASGNSADSATVVSVTAQLPLAPGPVATVEEMSKPWSVVKFQFHRMSGETANGMVIRLPGVPGYWGLLSVAPYGQCELQLETDLKKIRENYGFAASHPMVVDSCTQTVYDPLTLGGTGKVWVRGRVVAGPGLRPPLEVEIKVEDRNVIASRSE